MVASSAAAGVSSGYNYGNIFNHRGIGRERLMLELNPAKCDKQVSIQFSCQHRQHTKFIMRLNDRV